MIKKLEKIAFYGLKGITIPLINFTITAIGINQFGEKDWGSFIQILIWVYFIAFIANFGNKDFLLRIYSREPSKINKVFLSSLTSRSIFLFLSFVLLFCYSFKTSFAGIILCFLIYAYQSLDSLVVFKQKFGSQLVIEFIGSGVIIGGILMVPNMSLTIVLLFYCLSYFIRLLSQLLFLKINFDISQLQFSFDLIGKSFPFFLISFSGWMASKIDLYVVSFSLPTNLLAEYQILASFFLMTKASAHMILYPFSKHIYRLPFTSLKKIRKLLMLLSIPIILLATIFIWIVLEFIVNIHFPIEYYVLGAISTFPFFAYILTIMSLYRLNKEKIVLSTSLISILFYIIISSFLIPKFQIKGALIGVVLTQYIVMLIYLKYYKKFKLNQ